MKKLIHFSLVFFSIAPTAFPQEPETLPQFFVVSGDESKNLQQNLENVRNNIRDQSSDRNFWVGFRFEPRADLDFSKVHIHLDGGISISRGDSYFWIDDYDLQTQALRALSELGDEKAEALLKEKMSELREYIAKNWGLFLRLDTETLKVEKIRLLHFRSDLLADEQPIFWFGQVNTAESFAYFKGLIENQDYSAKVIKPAIFVLSLHAHAEVIPYLADLAGGERYRDIRESAAFWLGQIPDEASFTALQTIFEKERNRKMKEKLVFSMSQHQNDKVVATLTKIARTDDDFEVREKAIFWLGQRDGEESLDVLIGLLQEIEDRDLEKKAVFAISQHESPRAAETLIQVARTERDREVRKKAVFWLGQMAGRKTLEALGDIVETDDETEVKTKAVFAISQHRDRDEAVDMLMDIARNNPNAEVRKKAMFWLGQTGDERVIDFFKQVLTEN